MEKTRKRRMLEYLLLVSILAAIVAIYLSAVDDIATLFHLSKSRDFAAARDYLESFGLRGAAIVAILEMLQMIVVFIPAEFVQVSAGLAFPVYIALPVCMLGVFLGASAIFLLVRTLNLRLDLLASRSSKLQKIVDRINKDTPMVATMYILFIMPIIPFGAIAYFASSSKIPYKKYALTCTTGVIPSILSSYLLGNTMVRVMDKGTATFVVACCLVIAAMAVLLLGTAALLKKRFFVKKMHAPSPFYYTLVYRFIGLYLRTKLRIDRDDCEDLGDAPALILGGHTTFFDFYYAAHALWPRKPHFVTNRFYFRHPVVKYLLEQVAAIPKRLFTSDLDTVRSILTAARLGHDIVLFPEGRLSTDGTGFPPAGGGKNLVKLIRRIKMPVYAFTTSGGYFSYPKWRASLAKGRIRLHLHLLISAEETQALSDAQIESRISDLLNYDSSKNDRGLFDACDVTGLEHVLYHCPSCGAEFQMTSRKTHLTCTACGTVYEFDEDYRCSVGSISDWYGLQRRKLEALEDFRFTERCAVQQLGKNGRKMENAGSGECVLTEEGLVYTGTLGGEKVTLRQTPATLDALAFSCNEEFEFYHGNDLLYFYPEHRCQVAKWSALWDILSERYKVSHEK